MLNPAKKRRKPLVIASLLVAFFIGLPFSLIAEESHPLKERYRLQRQYFIDGRDLIGSGNIEQAAATIDQLAGYPLQSYYEYLILRQKLLHSNTPSRLMPAIEGFKDRYEDIRSYRRLLGVMKSRLAGVDDWLSYARVASYSDAPIHPCDDLYSRVTVDGLQEFDKSAASLWSVVSKHTKRCEQAFELLLERAGDVPTGALWKRTVALLKAESFDEVKQLWRFFSSRDRRIVQSWIDNLDDPEALFELEALNGNLKHHPSLLNHILSRWLSKDLLAATAYLKSRGSALGFSQQDIKRNTARHAVLAAKRALPEAASLLADASVNNKAVAYWRIRLALRDARWSDVIDHLDQLSDSEQASTRWHYWRARSLEALGRSSDARAIYEEIASQFTYYGFLAADRLADEYSVSSHQPIIDEKELSALQNNEEIIQAVEFFLVEIGWEGRRVWNAALKDAGNARLLAAAKLARDIEWFDRSFASIRKARYDAALGYQYPMPYQSLIGTLTQDRGVDDSLIYAIMRRESAYIPDVKSPAGAIGLMQLMPRTAREVAESVTLPATPWRLTDGETNVRLGVAYLDSMLARYAGNVAFAAAAYNAGPSRVNRWTDGVSLPMDVWIETIPFDETRDYVKSVLFNTAVFGVVRQQSPLRLLAMMESS